MEEVICEGGVLTRLGVWFAGGDSVLCDKSSSGNLLSPCCCGCLLGVPAARLLCGLSPVSTIGLIAVIVPCVVMTAADASMGDVMGDDSSSSVAGCCFSASNTKKASPACPSFIRNSHSRPFTLIVTSFSRDFSSCNLPNRTWNGVDVSSPSSCWTTTMSMAPESVAALKVSASWTLLYVLYSLSKR